MNFITEFFAKNGLIIVSFLEILLVKLGIFFLFIATVEALSRILKKDHRSFDIGWDLKGVVEVFLLYTAFQALTVFFKGDVEGANLEGLTIFWAIVQYLFLFVLIIFFVTHVFGSGPGKLGFVFKDMKGDLKTSFTVFVYLLMTCALVNILYSYEILAPTTKITRHVTLKEFFSGDLIKYLRYLLIFIIAPVTEETLYRGVIYPAVRNKVGSFFAVALVSAFFTVIHFEPQFFILVFLLSCMLCRMYEKRRSLVSPIIIHTAYNVFITLGLFHY